MNSILKLGTRGSPLALWQANRVARELKTHVATLTVEIIPIKTTGDQIQDRPLAEIGGKGLFVKEIEEALLENRIDIAVHSVKDMPAILPDGLVMSTFLAREEYRDALVSLGKPLNDLKPGAVIGTSSLRRRAMLAKDRPDLVMKECRGNVDTRLRKLESGEFDAIILSAAGLIRLGLEHRIVEYLDHWIPAVGQGVIGIEHRANDLKTTAYLKAIHSESTALCVAAERAFMRELEGNCQVPIGAFATLSADDQLHLKGFWVNPNRALPWTGQSAGDSQKAEGLGVELAKCAKTA